jgi:hypothetical protein
MKKWGHAIEQLTGADRDAAERAHATAATMPRAFAQWSCAHGRYQCREVATHRARFEYEPRKGGVARRELLLCLGHAERFARAAGIAFRYVRVEGGALSMSDGRTTLRIAALSVDTRAKSGR